MFEKKKPSFQYIFSLTNTYKNICILNGWLCNIFNLNFYYIFYISIFYRQNIKIVHFTLIQSIWFHTVMKFTQYINIKCLKFAWYVNNKCWLWNIISYKMFIISKCLQLYNIFFKHKNNLKTKELIIHFIHNLQAVIVQ